MSIEINSPGSGSNQPAYIQIVGVSAKIKLAVKCKRERGGYISAEVIGRNGSLHFIRSGGTWELVGGHLPTTTIAWQHVDNIKRALDDLIAR